MSALAPPDPSHPLFNPDSGRHPLPDDPREIAAVLQAAQRSYDMHPYYLARYGERGRTFTHSDGGYLVTLTTTWQSYVDEQISWLSSLLAARGMPSWLMETHLLQLHQALRSKVPEGAARFTKLRRASTRLRKLRCARMAQADFDAVADQFNATAGPGIGNAGGLIAAAVCDERGGSAEALPTLLKWLADPARFPPAWCFAVAQAVVRAQAAPIPAAPPVASRPGGSRG